MSFAISGVGKNWRPCADDDPELMIVGPESILLDRLPQRVSVVALLPCREPS